VINSPKYDVVEACYLFYYASDVAFAPGEDTEEKLKKRLGQLIGDALIIANQAKFDVFNAVSLMDNMTFLEDLKVSFGKYVLLFWLISYGFQVWCGGRLAQLLPVQLENGSNGRCHNCRRCRGWKRCWCGDALDHPIPRVLVLTSVRLLYTTKIIDLPCSNSFYTNTAYISHPPSKMLSRYRSR